MPSILFLADVHPKTHDLKWISHFSSSKINKCYLLPLAHQYKGLTTSTRDSLSMRSIQLLEPIHSFSIIKFYRTIFDLFYIKNIVLKNRIDIVHIQYADPNALWAIFRPFIGRPIILTTRGTDIYQGLFGVYSNHTLINYLLRILYRMAIRNMDFITCTSVNQLLQLEIYIGPLINKSIIRTGININNLDKALKGRINGKRNSKKFILFPRSMYRLYNHELALESIRLLNDRIRSEYAMVFLNSDSSDQEYVRHISELMRHDPFVEFHFLPTLSEDRFYDLIADASLVVMTNKSDGSPVTAMETLYIGTPLLLPPLDYDADIFGSVKKFDIYEALNVAKHIELILEGKVYNKESLSFLKRNIFLKCNRSTEMSKLKKIYERLIELDN